ncbi:acetyltransferase [Candidatus Woesearchaeota archaeon]|nr:acetyltransferase [Candidatus Woesearchaeota archaeon]
MNKKIVIVGAGGQGKNISLLIEQIGGWDILGYVDDNPQLKGSMVRGYLVLGSFQDVFNSLNNVAVVFAIGKSEIVKEKVSLLKSMRKDLSFPNIIHPTVSFSAKDVAIGEGNVINANVVLTTGIALGSFNYFNRCSSVSHDVSIGSFCFIHAGVHLSGNCVIGDNVWLGVNSTLIEGLKIGSDATVGAGAVVLNDVRARAIVVGNPAKILRFKNEDK